MRDILKIINGPVFVQLKFSVRSKPREVTAFTDKLEALRMIFHLDRLRDTSRVRSSSLCKRMTSRVIYAIVT